MGRCALAPNDANATIAYLDGGDATLVDAGGDSASGHQVDLAVDENVIKVKVTAEPASLPEDRRQSSAGLYRRFHRRTNNAPARWVRQLEL